MVSSSKLDATSPNIIPRNSLRRLLPPSSGCGVEKCVPRQKVVLSFRFATPWVPDLAQSILHYCMRNYEFIHPLLALFTELDQHSRPNRDSVTIGRSRHTVDVVLDLRPPTNTISRKHAGITRFRDSKGQGRFEILDLNSTNGVFVNTVKISSRVLEDGDVVQFGGAAGVPVGTSFTGDNTHIRYCFQYGLGGTLKEGRARKRRRAEHPVAAPCGPATPTRPLASPATVWTDGLVQHSLSNPPLQGHAHSPSAAEAVEALRMIASSGSSGVRGGSLASGHLIRCWSSGAKGVGAALEEGRGVGERAQPSESAEANVKEAAVDNSSVGSGPGQGSGVLSEPQWLDILSRAEQELKDMKAQVKHLEEERTKAYETIEGLTNEVTGLAGPEVVSRGGAGERVRGTASGNRVGRSLRRGRVLHRSAAKGSETSEDGGGGVASSKDAARSILAQARCGLCSKILVDAGILPCSHTFCISCWLGHVDKEKGTCCPSCLRQFHSSERQPRRCASLDNIVASLVHHLATPAERLQWDQRIHLKGTSSDGQVGTKPPVCTASTTGREGQVAVRTKGTKKKKPLRETEGVPRGRGEMRTGRRCTHASVNEGEKGPPLSKGKNQRLGQAKKQQSRGSVASLSNGAAAVDTDTALPEEEVDSVRCEGCNESGHGVDECPHRSDSSERESSSEESSGEGDFEEGDGDESDE